MYKIQMIFSIIALVFLLIVLIKQFRLLTSTTTEYSNIRKLLLAIVLASFLMVLVCWRPGHFVHSILGMISAVGWWLVYKIIEDENKINTQLTATNVSLKKDNRALTKDNKVLRNGG